MRELLTRSLVQRRKPAVQAVTFLGISLPGADVPAPAPEQDDIDIRLDCTRTPDRYRSPVPIPGEGRRHVRWHVSQV